MDRLTWVIVLSLALGVVCACNWRDSATPDYTRTPVLFIHGHGLSSKDWDVMVSYLAGAGYPRQYLLAVVITPNNMSNIQAATTVIAEAADSLLAQAEDAARSGGHSAFPPKRIDLVGHSMGAVSARWYAAKLHPERIRTWISLAGANHGTNSLCGLNDDGSKEMCPAFAKDAAQSAVQVELNGAPDAPVDETPYGVGADGPEVSSIRPELNRNILYLTVRIDPDAWIKPEHSAILDGAGGEPLRIPSGIAVRETSPGNYLFLDQVSHDLLLQHSDLLRLVAAMLAAHDE